MDLWRHTQLSVAVIVLLIMTGCAALETTQRPEQPPTERPSGPLPPSTQPTYNLMGYPPATQEGYRDGCETAKKSKWAFKDLERYDSDGQYRTGWDDGFYICDMKKN